MEGILQQDIFSVGARITSAAALAVFLLLGLPLLVSASEAGVVINELMWDGEEYVELFNSTSQEISLAGWTLTRQQAGGEVKVLVVWEEEDKLGAGEYYLLESKEEATTVIADKVDSSVMLVNTGELITLWDAQKNVVDQANQLSLWFAGDGTLEKAMERTTATSDGLMASSWHTSTGEAGGRFGTPKQINSQPHINEAPEAAITASSSGLVGEQLIFTAEDSSDAEDDDLTYGWTMGDDTALSGVDVAHSYDRAGTFVVEVTVSDGQAEDKAVSEVVINQPKYSDDIIINEWLPDPTGNDAEGEFIELKNKGNELVDLVGWRLDDAEGGSVEYVIPPGVKIGAGEIRLFKREETKLALNNSSDSVRLKDPLGRIKTEQSYEKTEEGYSFNWHEDGSPKLSTTPTPGSANNVTVPVDKEEVDEEDEQVPAAKGAVAGSKITKIDLAQVRQEEKGEMVEVIGVVSVPPGVLGGNVIYLAGSGVQVYFSKADWPKINLGDSVKLTGEVSANSGETRLKLAQASDLIITGNGAAPQPHRLETSEVGEETEGWLVTIQGEVTETNGDTFYVDDGSGEVKVYIKSSTKIDKPQMKKGMAITVTGVVSETSSGYRVLPRWQEDVRLGLVAGMTSFPATGGASGWLMIVVGIVMWLLRGAWREREPLMSY